jgi:hypothetical protein
MYMKCHWTAQAEAGVGYPLIAGLGIALIFFANPKIRLGLAIGGSRPAYSPRPHRRLRYARHACRKITFPAVAVLGKAEALITGVGAGISAAAGLGSGKRWAR